MLEEELKDLYQCHCEMVFDDLDGSEMMKDQEVRYRTFFAFFYRCQQMGDRELIFMQIMN